MDQEIIYDFDAPVSREGTYAEKYDARQRFFGRPDVVPLWVADMDLPSPDFLLNTLHHRLDHPLLGYTEQYAAVFDAIRWWMADQHAVEVEEKWVLLSPSVVTSMCMAVQAFTDPGDSVAVLSPVYGPFFTTATNNDRNVADCPLLVRENRFEIDFESLEETLSKPDVKLMMFSNPHNPGGRVWSKEELYRLAQLCAAHNVVLFSDEIHSDIVYPPHRNTSMLHIDGARSNTILAHSIGKTFNTSGMQASFCIIPDPTLRRRFRRAQNAVHTGDINLLGKTALATALSPQGAAYKQQLTAYLHENINEVCRRVRTISHVEVMVPDATFLVWCDFRKLGPWQDVFKRLVQNAGVALSGGTFFGPAGEGWFRINCAHPRTQLYPAVDRIVKEFAP